MKLPLNLKSVKPDPLANDLFDDGQRFVSRGRTKVGNYQFTNFDNPQVIADTIFQKSLRSQIQAHNAQRFF